MGIFGIFFCYRYFGRIYLPITRNSGNVQASGPKFTKISTIEKNESHKLYELAKVLHSLLCTGGA